MRAPPGEVPGFREARGAYGGSQSVERERCRPDGIGRKTDEAHGCDVASRSSLSDCGVRCRNESQHDRKHDVLKNQVHGCCVQTTLSVRIVGIWIEKLLPIDLVTGNGVLPFRRNQPINESLAEVFLHIGMFLGVHQHHAILIE
jgi:hypothetical protein